MVLWREDATKSIVLLIVIGVIVAIIALTLNGSYLSVGSFQAKSCKSVETSPGQTEYTCKLPGTGLGWPQTLVLQGATGSSFARLVKHTYDFAP